MNVEDENPLSARRLIVLRGEDVRRAILNLIRINSRRPFPQQSAWERPRSEIGPWLWRINHGSLSSEMRRYIKFMKSSSTGEALDCEIDEMTFYCKGFNESICRDCWTGLHAWPRTGLKGMQIEKRRCTRVRIVL